MREECICLETCHSHSLLFQGTFYIFLPLLSYPHLFFVKLLPALRSSGLFTEITNKDIQDKNRHGFSRLLCSLDFTTPQTENYVEARRFKFLFLFQLFHLTLKSHFGEHCSTNLIPPRILSHHHTQNPFTPPNSDLKLSCSRKPHPDKHPIVQWIWESFQKKLNTVLWKKYQKTTHGSDCHRAGALQDQPLSSVTHHEPRSTFPYEWKVGLRIKLTNNSSFNSWKLRLHDRSI